MKKRKEKEICFAPDIVSFAVCFAFPKETGTGLVEVLITVGALEAGGMPGEVGRYPQYELVVDLSPAADAHSSVTFLPWNKVNTPHYGGRQEKTHSLKFMHATQTCT